MDKEKIISTDNDILKDPPPRVGINLLDPDGYHLGINVWTQSHNFIDTKLALQVRILEALKAGGVKLPGM